MVFKEVQGKLQEHMADCLIVTASKQSVPFHLSNLQKVQRDQFRLPPVLHPYPARLAKENMILKASAFHSKVIARALNEDPKPVSSKSESPAQGLGGQSTEEPEESIKAPWHRLGPYPPTGLHVDKDPMPLGNEKDGWCALCGVRSGWMQCGRCAGQGEYLTLPGRAGVKDRVGVARCKMCYGRGAVPCFFCGLTDMAKWEKWQAYAARNPVKKKRK